MTHQGTRLEIDDPLLTKAVTAYLSLGITAQSMTINSYMTVWGLGNDSTHYSNNPIYQHVLTAEFAQSLEVSAPHEEVQATTQPQEPHCNTCKHHFDDTCIDGICYPDVDISDIVTPYVTLANLRG
jgi:hypothetical protein